MSGLKLPKVDVTNFNVDVSEEPRVTSLNELNKFSSKATYKVEIRSKDEVFRADNVISITDMINVLGVTYVDKPSLDTKTIYKSIRKEGIVRVSMVPNMSINQVVSTAPKGYITV